MHYDKHELHTIYFKEKITKKSFVIGKIEGYMILLNYKMHHIVIHYDLSPHCKKDTKRLCPKNPAGS